MDRPSFCASAKTTHNPQTPPRDTTSFARHNAPVCGSATTVQAKWGRCNRMLSEFPEFKSAFWFAYHVDI